MTSLPHLPQVCTPRSGVFLHSPLGVGCAVAWDGDFKEQTEGDSFSNVLDLFLNCASFIYIGAWLPFDQFRIPELGITPWRLVLLMLAILALRRIPFLLVLYKFLPEVENWRDALLCGHFGPVGSLRIRNFHSTDSLFQIGVSAVFICNYAQTRLEVPRNPPLSQQDLLATALQPILSFVVLGSILIRMSSPFRFRGRLSMFAIFQMAFPFRSFRSAVTSLAR